MNMLCSCDGPPHQWNAGWCPPQDNPLTREIMARNIPAAEMITAKTTNFSANPVTGRPFNFDKNITVAEYTVNEFSIEFSTNMAYIGFNDGTRWGGLQLGSAEMDEFLTILNYHHAKAKGEL